MPKAIADIEEETLRLKQGVLNIRESLSHLKDLLFDAYQVHREQLDKLQRQAEELAKGART